MIRSKHMLSLVVLLAGSLNATQEAPALNEESGQEERTSFGWNLASYKKELVAVGAVIIGAVVWKTYRPSMRPSKVKASRGSDGRSSGSSSCSPNAIRSGGSTAEANSDDATAAVLDSSQDHYNGSVMLVCQGGDGSLLLDNRVSCPTINYAYVKFGDNFFKVRF